MGFEGHIPRFGGRLWWFCVNPGSHHKCHSKVTTDIKTTFFGLVARRKLIVLFGGCSSRGWGGLLSKTAVSEAISGSRAVHTCCRSTAAWRETWLGPTKHNSQKYIARREISTSLRPLSAVFIMCYANAHAAIGQRTCTELAWGA